MKVGPTESAVGVPGNALSVAFGEELEHFSRVSMPTCFRFGVEHLTVNGDIEYTLGPSSEGQSLHDVLIIGQKV